MPFILRGQELVEVDVLPPKKERAKRLPKIRTAPPELRCGTTKTSYYTDTFEPFLNQCIKEKHTAGACLFETKGKHDVSRNHDKSKNPV